MQLRDVFSVKSYYLKPQEDPDYDSCGKERKFSNVLKEEFLKRLRVLITDVKLDGFWASATLK